jgi:hypothetical protein
VSHVYLGPELAHTARHQVGVPVEIGACLERGELALVLTGKDAQVLGHALDDGGEEPPHARLIRRGERPVGREDRGQALEQPALGGQRLRARRGIDDGGDAAGPRQGQLLAERLEMDDPRAPLDESRVGDGVRSPREEIGEADGRAHRSGQHRHGQVEGATDLLEERAGEVAPRHDAPSPCPSGSRAGRASPWPS